MWDEREGGGGSAPGQFAPASHHGVRDPHHERDINVAGAVEPSVGRTARQRPVQQRLHVGPLLLDKVAPLRARKGSGALSRHHVLPCEKVLNHRVHGALQRATLRAGQLFAVGIALDDEREQPAIRLQLLPLPVRPRKTGWGVRAGTHPCALIFR